MLFVEVGVDVDDDVVVVCCLLFVVVVVLWWCLLLFVVDVVVCLWLLVLVFVGVFWKERLTGTRGLDLGGGYPRWQSFLGG